MSREKWDYCDCHSSLPEDEELDFFDMVDYRNWDVHPESLKKNLEEETMFYYFRYWYGLGNANNFRNSRGFWEYTDKEDDKQATFCSMRIKSMTLDYDDSPTTTTTTTKTTNPTTTKPTTKPTTKQTTKPTPQPDSCNINIYV